MRAFEFLSEASIFSRGTYTFGHKVKVAAENKEGKIAIEKIQNVFPDFVPSETLEWVENAPADAPRILISKSKTEKYFKRENDDIFAFVGGPSTIESILNHAERINRGDIAEAILGAALSAKLIKRGSDRIGTVDNNDIQTVLVKAIATTSGTLIYTVEDKNSSIADKISFRLRLPSGSMDIIKNKKTWSKFEDLFSSALSYANSTDAEKYSNHFYRNGKVDEVLITSDGVSEQKGRKTDIDVVVRDPETGKVRNLKSLDLSLKADSVKYGQSTSGGLTKDYNEWYIKAKNVFEPFGITIDMPTDGKDNILSFYIEVYKQAAEKLNSALTGNSADKETNFVEKVADVINTHGSGANPNLKIVSFEKGNHTVHSFATVKQRMIKNNINLAARYKLGGRSGKPSVEIFDSTTNEMLTSIRFYLTSKASTNYFEKGPLLHKLTMVMKTKPPAPVEPTPISDKNVNNLKSTEMGSDSGLV
jgi:hypothetical protein